MTHFTVQLFDSEGSKVSDASLIASWSQFDIIAKGCFGGIALNEINITILTENARIVDFGHPFRKPILCSSYFFASQAGSTRRFLKDERLDLDRRTRQNDAALKEAYDHVKKLEEKINNPEEEGDLRLDAARRTSRDKVQRMIEELQEQSLTLRTALNSWQIMADEYAEKEAEAARQAALRHLVDEAV
jgi:hypothetical protein